MKGKGGYWEVFKWRTGEVVSSFDREYQAQEECEKLGSDYDYAAEGEGEA